MKKSCLLITLTLLLLAGCGPTAQPTAAPVPPGTATPPAQPTAAPAPPGTATPPPDTATTVPPTVPPTAVPKTEPTAASTPTPAVPPTETPIPATATPRPTLSGSGGGVLAFIRAREDGWSINVINADGSEHRLILFHAQGLAYPEWSPDGQQIAFHKHQSDEVYSINVIDADGSNEDRLTDNGTQDSAPVWSPDGSQIAFTRDGNIWIMNADGSDQRLLMEDPVMSDAADWSPDGRQIVFESARHGDREIYVMDADGTNLQRLTDNEAEDWWPTWSPDGSQIAFMSTLDGDWEIYVMDADGGNLRQLTENSVDDRGPAWSPDGSRIAFVSNRHSGVLHDTEIYIMNADGSNPQRITEKRGFEWGVDWRPEPAALPAYTPIYEPTDCRFPELPGPEVECGDLIVPEDRSQPDGPQIRLHVAIFKCSGPDPQPDPVVHLVGGPGGSLLDDADAYLSRGGYDILRTRDYIMFNQRGTHYAEPFLECPGRTAFQWELAAEGLTLEERNQREVEFLLDCQDNLLAQGINLSAYNSAESAADVNDLRIALGYEQINLYGVSYGSRLALTTMRDYPEGIRSTIIDAVLPPQANLNQDIALNVYRSLNAVFEDCAADAACSQNYPDLEATFYQVVDELNSSPVSLKLPQGSVVVDGYAFTEAIFQLLYSVDAIPWIPLLIEQAGQGEHPETSIFAVPNRGTWGTGMRYSVWCREEAAFESRETALALAAELPAVFSEFFADAYDWTVCASWEAGVADPIENQAVVSDIPTLVLSGRYDPVTPPAWGKLATETLTNSFFYEFPNMAHGVMRSNRCALEIGMQFLNDPTSEPDTSCMEELRGTEFK
ncbi:MAG: alpha/beta fold hydrolase [Chloroflexia bacterium]|nr:alpha/beta fold hydrolase [Chloroflexia bacterium]